jgi:hypothetical protein
MNYELDGLGLVESAYIDAIDQPCPATTQGM